MGWFVNPNFSKKQKGYKILTIEKSLAFLFRQTDENLKIFHL